MKHPCPICGDPNAYPFWVDPDPPEGCPDDREWMQGRAPSIRNVTECARQMRKARQAAEFRKLCPDAFDENGKMKDGRLADVLRTYERAHPGKALVI